MSIKASARILLNFQSDKEVSSMIAALTPEISSPTTKRSVAKLERDDLIVILTVEADDTVALRSTMNAYLHWIASTQRIVQLIGDDKLKP